MVKGRSLTRIQDELYMSKGTVNTHLHHIYRKLGIHTKQELLDLVEKEARPLP
jgi:DNA-binding CsgD family transcriptional regulator